MSAKVVITERCGDCIEFPGGRGPKDRRMCLRCDGRGLVTRSIPLPDGPVRVENGKVWRLTRCVQVPSLDQLDYAGVWLGGPEITQ